MVNMDNDTRVVDSGLTWNKWLAKYNFNVKRLGNCIENYNGVIQTSMLTGRGTLVPVNVYREIGLYDAENLPQYTADWDFSLRANRKGYKLIICYKAVVKSEVSLTGIGSKYERPNIKRFLSSFFTIKSPNWWKARFYFAKRNLPWWYFIIYLLKDYIRIIGSFFRRYLYMQIKKQRTNYF